MKRMTPAEFRSEGFLQEMNRLFLHPLGLALEVIVDDDGIERFGEVWDCRDDPEGIIFDSTVDLFAHASHVHDLWHERTEAREAALGWHIQPATRATDQGADT